MSADDTRPNWLRMTPADFGHQSYRRPSVTAGDVKALHAHARKLRRERERSEAANR